jgi:hypothetical protein
VEEHTALLLHPKTRNFFIRSFIHSFTPFFFILLSFFASLLLCSAFVSELLIGHYLLPTFYLFYLASSIVQFALLLSYSIDLRSGFSFSNRKVHLHISMLLHWQSNAAVNGGSKILRRYNRYIAISLLGSSLFNPKRNTQTNRNRNRNRNRQTDKQTNRQTDKQTNRQTDKQTNRQTESCLSLSVSVEDHNSMLLHREASTCIRKVLKQYILV